MRRGQADDGLLTAGRQRRMGIFVMKKGGVFAPLGQKWIARP